MAASKQVLPEPASPTPLATKSKVAAQAKKWLRRAPVFVAVVIFALAVWVLHRQLSAIQPREIMAQLHTLAPHKVLLALLFTMMSYLLLTNYDRLALKHLGRKFSLLKIQAISFTAFAIGHNVGVAAISGGSIRYRAYSTLGLSAYEISTVIVFCSLTFAIAGSLLLGITLALEPASALLSVALSESAATALAIVLIAFPLLYVLAALFVRRSISLAGWTIAVPKFTIAVQQLLFASIDLLAAAATLYVLLPADINLTYPVLLGAYLIAVFLGALSSVPGGIGVFEGLLLVLLPDIPKAELLGAIVAYRLIYYLLPLALAMVIMAFQEFAPHRQRVTSVFSTGVRWASSVAPLVIGSALFIAGAGLLVSGSIPAIGSRLHFMADFIPLPLLEASHLLNSAVGAGMLIVARGLYLRLRGAYHMALLLLLTGVLVSLGKGLDFEESAALIVTATLLWLSRNEFSRSAALVDQRFSAGWVLSILGVLGAAAWIGFFVHKHVEYRDALWWQFAFNADAPRMLRGILVSALVVIAFALFRLTRAAPPLPQAATREDLAKAKGIIATSDSAAANVALLGDKRFLFHPSGAAFIMYQVSGNSWIAMGDPVGALECFQDLVWQFRELSNRYADRCAFYQVTETHLSLYVDMGLSLSKLGEDARVALADFSLTGRHNADLRQAHNRAQRSGVSFSIIPAKEVVQHISELRQVSVQWLHTKAAHEKGFSLGVFEPEYLTSFDCAVVTVDTRIVAFANLWQSGDRQELSVDLMRYSDKAPKNTMDYLLIELMLWGKAQGFQRFMLGMAPLAGLEKHPLAPLWNKVGNSIFRMGDNFYNFEGLRRYKDKFNPRWEPLYLAAPGGLALPRVLMDTTVLISGGVKQVFAK